MAYYFTDVEKILVLVGDSSTISVQEDISGKPNRRAFVIVKKP